MPERVLPPAGVEGTTPRPPLSLLSPWVVFPILGLVLVASVLLTPASGRDGDARLTTLGRGPQGARGFAEVLGRLGWRVERDSMPAGVAPLDAGATYAVLDPPEPLTAREIHRYLDAVRRGAGLVVVAGTRGEGFADSLGVHRGAGGAPQRLDSTRVAACPDDEKTFGIDWPDGRVASFWLVPFRPLRDTVHFIAVDRPRTRAERRADAKRAERTPGRTASAGEEEEDDDDDEEDEEDDDTANTAGVADSARNPLSPRRRPAAAAMGLPLGAGRVAILADPDWLRNDVLRVCKWYAGVSTVRMMDWVAGAPGGASRRLVVDEYHQGRGPHPSALRTIGRFLAGDARGRALLASIAAVLLFLAAAALRALAPARRGAIERRSPLEHVGALARAYEQVGATRLATRRLVRGMRRRRVTGNAGSARATDDREWLDALERRQPALAPQIGVVRDALTQPRTPAELVTVGRAVAHIERTIRQ